MKVLEPSLRCSREFLSILVSEGSFSKFICFIVVESIETKVGESSETTAQTRISEIVFYKITCQKLDGNNYLQWKRVLSYVAGRGKTSHLLVDSPTPLTNPWTLEANNLLHQILTTIEPKIQDLVFHYVIVKELWYFLRELY